MLRSCISGSTEQEPAFQVKPRCFEIGIDSGQIFKPFSQIMCTLPLEASWAFSLLSSTVSSLWIFGNWNFDFW